MRSCRNPKTATLQIRPLRCRAKKVEVGKFADVFRHNLVEWSAQDGVNLVAHFLIPPKFLERFLSFFNYSTDRRSIALDEMHLLFHIAYPCMYECGNTLCLLTTHV